MTTTIKDKKATFLTLGCKLNFAETSSLRDQLVAKGVRVAEKGEKADICIVNTCSVTDMADQKCRQAIHKLTRENPGALTVVLGCYAQLKPEEISQLEGVDVVLGMEQKGDALRYIERTIEKKVGLMPGESCHEAIAVPLREIRTFVPSCSCGDRTRYFLKVQDGCNYYCTYCTIPIARGRSRSGSVAEIVSQAEEVVQKGGREIVLTGVNIGDFGAGTQETFFDLVQGLDTVEGIARYRISSIEPNLLTDDILCHCASSQRFMPHFHIPLQSGSDTVLHLMRRKYDTALFAHKVARVRELMPDAFIGVDVIVGTRGETDELFEEAFRFIEGLDISQLHVFSYSERPGTKALEIEHKVDKATKHERSQRLLALSEKKRMAFYHRFIGQERPVLWEQGKVGAPMQGFTDNYIRVSLPYGYEQEANSITTVKLGNFSADKSTLLADV